MPKAAAYRLIWCPEREVYELRESHSNQLLLVAPASHEWFDWLAAVPSFTFRGQAGQLTARQEGRPRGGTYWYASRRIGEQMAKRYLGRTTDLTLARLEEIAAQLAEAALRAGQGTVAREVSRAEMPAQRERPSPIVLLQGALPASEVSPPPQSHLHDVRLATQFAVPRLRTRLVRRTRLLKQLGHGLDATLTLLSAPAGFGKTTLLAQWLTESRLPSVWISLELADNEPVRFLSALIAALRRLDPHVGTAALACLHSPPSSPETVVALLVSDLSQQAHEDFILVLDDYHVITTDALHQALTSFVEHAPPHLRLAIATRSDPALPLSRLRAQGALCEVRVAQLQFFPEETRTFLHMVMGLHLSAEERTVLQQRTEGWIAGLQLAALSLQSRSDRSQFLADFSGSHRSIVDYLVEEVLARQPEMVQSFLLHTSILDRLTGPLCNALTGRSDSAALLEQLERANLFIVPLDERRRWYRYHHLFAEMLQGRVQREMGTEGLAGLYARASVWYEQNGMQALAIEAALEAHDVTRAARLIEPLARSMLVSFQHATLRRWLECFPQEALVTQAFLCLIYAHSLFTTSETPGAHEGSLAVAERLFQAEGNRTGLGQTCTLRAEVAMERGDAEEAISYGTQALQLLPVDALLERSTSANALAGGYRERGEVTVASRVLSEARSLHEQSGNIPALLGDTLILGNLLVMQGKLHQAATLYPPVLEAAGAWQSLAICALIGLGDIAREQNNLDGAEAYLEQALTLAGRTRDMMLQARTSLLQARVIQARGDAERTMAAFTQAQALAQQCRYRGLVEQVQAHQARSWLQQGRMDVVIRWQQATPFARDAPPTYQQEVTALTLARILIAQGEAGDALRLLECWHRHARAQGRTGSEIELLVLSALAQQTQGKREQAVQLLQQALLLASPEGYVRVFVDEGVPMVALLSLVLSRWQGKTEADEVRRLLAVVQAEPLARGSRSLAISRWEPPLEPLSSRERKVLRGLCAGLSNAEIAAELVVSINTVRTQARSIYRKLNVHTRQEAVALAHHWRLL